MHMWKSCLPNEKYVTKPGGNLNQLKINNVIFIMQQVQEKHQAKKKKLYFYEELVRWNLRKLVVDEWLICTVIALHTEDCTVVRTDDGLSFEVKVGLHQRSVLSPLLFAAAIDVSSEARSGLPSELLYSDDLVLMAPTMVQIGRRVAEWRASRLDK